MMINNLLKKKLESIKYAKTRLFASFCNLIQPIDPQIIVTPDLQSGSDERQRPKVQEGTVLDSTSMFFATYL